MGDLLETVSEIYGPILALMIMVILWIPRTLFWYLGCALCWLAEWLDRFGTAVSDRLIG